MSQHDDLFHPESVDEQIDQLSQADTRLYSQPHDQPDAMLVQDMQRMYRIEAEHYQRTLERARQRIEEAQGRDRHAFHEQPTMPLPASRLNMVNNTRDIRVNTQLPAGVQRRRRGGIVGKQFQRSIALVAAVLVVCLLVGSLFAVLNIARQTNTSVRPQQTPTATPHYARGAVVYTYHDRSPIYAVSWSPDGQHIASVSSTIQIWNPTTGHQELIHTPPKPANFFTASWSPDGSRIASGAPVVEVWSASTGKQQVSCPDPGSLTTRSAGNGFFAATSPDKGQNIQLLSARVTDTPPLPPMLAWSPDGKYIAQAYQSGTKSMVVVWDASNCHVKMKYQNQDTPFDVAWSPDGKYIAFSSSDNTVEVLDFAQQKVIYTYHDPFHTNIYRLAWSPDGQRIATASYSSHTVEVWDATTGKNRIIYNLHTQPVAALAWSPDGKYIASGGSVQQGTTLVGEVQIWDSHTGEHLFTYQGNPHPVLALAWSPNGQLIASADGNQSGSGDSTVKVWKAV